MNLRYSSGNILSEDVHKIGIIALGSHLENHGICLPIDTDAKIASYIALEASVITGAKFLGVIYSAGEFEYIDHGKHNSYEEVSEEIYNKLAHAKKILDISDVIIVNAHGGNTPIKTFLPVISDELDMNIVFNNYIVENEGPHGGTGEVSIGSIIGITDETCVHEQSNLDKYGEIGLFKFEEARKIDEGIDEGALSVERDGVTLDTEIGLKLLHESVDAIVKDVNDILG